MRETTLSAASLGRPLARGRTADVYAWEPGLVLKLFHDGFGQPSVEREAQIAAAVHGAGLPVPAAFELLRVDGRAGLLYERVSGPPMLELLRRRPGRMLRLAHTAGEREHPRPRALAVGPAATVAVTAACYRHA